MAVEQCCLLETQCAGGGEAKERNCVRFGALCHRHTLQCCCRGSLHGGVTIWRLSQNEQPLPWDGVNVNGSWVINIQQSILFLGFKTPSAWSQQGWTITGGPGQELHPLLQVCAEGLLSWQTRHELRCNSSWMIQSQPSRNDRCHLKSCYIKQSVFNCSNHLMLHTHFKRVVLGRLATCCVRGVLIHLCSFTALLCTTNHWQSSKLESNVTEKHFLTFPAPLSPLTMMDWFTGSICFWTFL